MRLTRDFAMHAPRLAIAGLNPHAGEDGDSGREEIESSRLPSQHCARGGIDVIGPLPADTMFHAEARARYDAALCMYHDQALIPLKTLAFWDGVNVTLGLPIVRTSPDHGTALDIAGTGKADPRSMIAAIELAAAMADAQSAVDPFAAVARRHRRAWARREEIAWPELSPRSQSHAPHRARRRTARRHDRSTKWARTRRADARAC